MCATHRRDDWGWLTGQEGGKRRVIDDRSYIIQGVEGCWGPGGGAWGRFPMAGAVLQWLAADYRCRLHLPLAKVGPYFGRARLLGSGPVYTSVCRHLWVDVVDVCGLWIVALQYIVSTFLVRGMDWGRVEGEGLCGRPAAQTLKWELQ